MLLCAAATLLVSGCASDQTYYAAAPPPPPPVYSGYNGPPPLVEYAEHEGFRAGMEDGSRDAYNGWGFHPQRDRRFHETPGYDPRLGPFGPYRNYFRNAYVRGYERGFRGAR